MQHLFRVVFKKINSDLYAHTAYISSTPIGTFSNGSQRNGSNNILKGLLLISNSFFFNKASGISAVVPWIIPALRRIYISLLYCRCLRGGNIVGKMLFHVRF